MKTLLALDLGTNTGFACGTAGHHISGTWGLKPGRFDGGGMRYVKFRNKLTELYSATKFEAVYFEEVRKHRGTDAAHIYGGLMATLSAWCEENGVPYEGVPVGTIKKFATGKGNAGKPEMIEGVREWGYEPATDDEADAIAILRLKLVELGEAREARREAA